jgi:hypothetical protein
MKHYVIQAGDNQRERATEDWTSRGKDYSKLDSRLMAIFEKRLDSLMIYGLLFSSDM